MLFSCCQISRCSVDPTTLDSSAFRAACYRAFVCTGLRTATAGFLLQSVENTETNSTLCSTIFVVVAFAFAVSLERKQRNHPTSANPTINPLLGVDNTHCSSCFLAHHAALMFFVVHDRIVKGIRRRAGPLLPNSQRTPWEG